MQGKVRSLGPAVMKLVASHMRLLRVASGTAVPDGPMLVPVGV
eukprot:CAMPEP_0174380934 /NCGR_PEP_ID=MMETSP0811_2-20130205/123687_1 /TAXON_ID=73025 ORGANISM="Eutreptiella gymnastica-like, Strain CCMP1594" /NCGR_SAMPLE_ID=MMETSP0811_2 /ASSEMBLY_ACC=CAM_ASM_000667 /LENGTH=42 /DNA_ID= /DNA_START= /DNA_END= /DNA_ORIENTATION=